MQALGSGELWVKILPKLSLANTMPLWALEKKCLFVPVEKGTSSHPKRYFAGIPLPSSVTRGYQCGVH